MQCRLLQPRVHAQPAPALAAVGYALLRRPPPSCTPAVPTRDLALDEAREAGVPRPGDAANTIAEN